MVSHDNDSLERKCACKGNTLTRFVQPVILTILAEGDDYGYSILSKLAATILWLDNKPDASGVYRSLKDMENRGLVESYLDMDDKKVIAKRVFSITDKGRECMLEWAITLVEYERGIDEIIANIRRLTFGQ